MRSFCGCFPLGDARFLTLSKFTNIMILTKAAPRSELLKIYLSLNDNHMKKRLLNSIVEENSIDVIFSFLKQITRAYSDSNHSDRYFEKAELKSFLLDLTYKFEKKLTPDLVELLYFAYSSVLNPEYKVSSMNLSKVFETIGLPEAVKKDLQLWKKKYSSDSWVLEKILQSKVVKTKLGCINNY